MSEKNVIAADTIPDFVKAEIKRLKKIIRGSKRIIESRKLKISSAEKDIEWENAVIERVQADLCSLGVEAKKEVAEHSDKILKRHDKYIGQSPLDERDFALILRGITLGVTKTEDELRKMGYVLPLDTTRESN
jgi:hypothetical protein